MLRCPTCRAPLTLGRGAVRCANRHSFDVARQGYVNLHGGPQPGTADTADMVRARADLLGSGVYSPLAAAVVTAAGPGTGPVVEVGAGTAYYLAAVLRARRESVGLALDISVPASRRAAGAHPRAGAVVADAWGELPLAEDSAEVVLVVFAPRGGAEIARVLRPAGRLVVLTPTAAHLVELAAPLGLLGIDERKAERLHAALDPWFDVESVTPVRFGLQLGLADLERLAAMGPSAFHSTAHERLRRIGQVPVPAVVTVAVTVTSLRRR